MKPLFSSGNFPGFLFHSLVAIFPLGKQENITVKESSDMNILPQTKGKNSLPK